MIASTSTESSRSSVPRLQPFHHPSTRSSMLTILPKTFLAQHQLLRPNVMHLARASNKLGLTSERTGALALPMGATLAKGVIKLMGEDHNILMGPTFRTTRVTTVNRMEATEVLSEVILNKTGRIALRLNRGIEAFCFVFRPFPLLLLGFSLLALANLNHFNAT